MLFKKSPLILGIICFSLYIPSVYSENKNIPTYTYKIVNTYPHSRKAYTQGLVFEDGALYEGTGLYGHSSIRKIDLKTGKILRIHRLPKNIFGEGITIYKNRIIQLTWKAKKGFVYNKDTFKLKQKFRYSCKGWGITHDGKNLIMSDGTSSLYFSDPKTFKETRRIKVYNNKEPVKKLNELEYIKGEVYANIWKKDLIAKISPKTGEVTGWIDLKGLLPTQNFNKRDSVLNGIAYDKKNDRLFVTGKLWPKLFEIKLIPITKQRKPLQ
jgi:glutamine cyclotransferase